MHKMKKYVFFLSCLLAGMLFLTGCGRSQGKEETTAEENTTIEQVNPEKIDDITMEALVFDVLDDMTLKQKIGQLFIVCTDSLDFNAETSMTKEMKKNLKKYQPGGVIFFSFNLENRKQTTKFIRKMQKKASIPMFMSVDEEGGSVARIANTEEMGTTKFPSMSAIGETGDASRAYIVGETIGREISALGFNLDFAPVADITTNEKNTEIGERSFGSDPALVADMVFEEVKGLQETGVSATLKHFPGQGDSSEDTHRGYSDLKVNIDRLRSTEFLPFEKGIKAGADFVMMSHVSISSVTQSEVPASLSSLMVSDILRDELQYDNIIITDAMNMKIITKFYESDQAAVMAIDAGNDMILMPDDLVSAYTGLYDAVKDGTLSESQIDSAVARILEVKIRRGILPLDSNLFSNRKE